MNSTTTVRRGGFRVEDITFRNARQQSEILNEGVGFSIDSPTSERAYTFVARAVDSMVPVAGDTENRIWTSW